MLHRRLIDQRLAFLADTVYAAIVMLDIYTGWLTALGADQHNIRYVKRSFKLKTARIDGTALSLNCLLMLGMDIQALDDHAMLIRQDFDYLAAFPFVFYLSADQLNGITFTNLNSHRSLLNRPKALRGPAIQSS
jgi:hypothetical protein